MAPGLLRGVVACLSIHQGLMIRKKLGDSEQMLLKHNKNDESWKKELRNVTAKPMSQHYYLPNKVKDMR